MTVKSEPSVNILLLGSWHGKNKGDLAILMTEVAELRRRLPGARFALPTKNPSLLKKYLGEPEYITYIKTYYSMIGPGVFRAMERADIIVIGGGGLFFSEKLWNPGYSHLLNLYFLMQWNSRFSHKPVAIFCVGAETVNGRFANSMLRSVLASVKQISVRDVFSRNVLKSAGKSPQRITVQADPVLLLKAQTCDLPYLDHIPKPRLLICLNEKACRQIDPAELVQPLLSKYGIVLYKNDHTPFDEEHIRSSLSAEDNRRLAFFSHERHPLTPAELVHFFSCFDVIVTVPLHGLIFAHLAGVPAVFPFAYADKVRAYSSRIGLRAYELQQLAELPVILSQAECSKPASFRSLAEQAEGAFGDLAQFIRDECGLNEY